MGNGNLWRVTYSYNLGGQLTHVRGYKSYGYDYVNKIGYDKFEQRTYLKYCNGVETFYSYDPQRRRLQNLAVNAGGKTIMDNAYGYDVVSNVLSVVNKAAYTIDRLLHYFSAFISMFQQRQLSNHATSPADSSNITCRIMQPHQPTCVTTTIESCNVTCRLEI